MIPERRRSFRALVVEDDDAILRLVKTVLEREQFTVEGVTGGARAIELLKVAAYDLMILDLMMPDVSGEDVLGYLEIAQPKYLRRVILTTASPRRFSCAFLHRICRMLEKPFDVDQLVLFARECATGEDCAIDPFVATIEEAS
jgi:DNA-binding response OmpR family regulator